ncbi:extensin-like domain-containing protein [Cypionkella psychrotolerans]|uniref:extensin-like domain-containing protein n=1 Tax=Cypionkella psychrotolerans TaxID=1678131 RepID=UPI0006B69484|nr:extensin family protein [Cypionkella psychrotolerans]
MPRPQDAPTAAAPAQVTPPQAVEETENVAAPSRAIAAKGQRDLLRQDDATYASCLVALHDLAVVYEEVVAVVPEDDVDCGILQPIKVSEIAPGVALVPPAVIRCPTAQALASWVQDFVLPAAARLDGRGALTAIENGSGYTCRRRNNEDDGALSEHAFGNAFDVMGFRFELGSPVMVGPGKSQDGLARAFQDAVWASACLDFATVLGPGSNASHEDHLHFDIIARKNGFRICELGAAIEE